MKVSPESNSTVKFKKIPHNIFQFERNILFYDSNVITMFYCPRIFRDFLRTSANRREEKYFYFYVFISFFLVIYFFLISYKSSNVKTRAYGLGEFPLKNSYVPWIRWNWKSCFSKLLIFYFFFSTPFYNTI